MPNTRDTIFSRVFVDYAVAGVARVSWELRKGFRDPAPHTYQVQVNYNGGSDSPSGTPDAEWCDVGTSFVNNNSYCCDLSALTINAYDDTQRIFGKNFNIVYRVKLTTSSGTYYSEPATVLGNLSKHQWLSLRAMQRRIKLKSKSLVSHLGYLLKRKAYGTACSACLDPHTGGVTDSNCATCKGTGITDGYWKAAENTMYDMSPEAIYTQRDNNLTRGTTTDITVQGSFIGVPLINSRDIWVEKDSDKRYVIHTVKHAAEINQVPVNVIAELRLVPANDVIYTISLEGS